MTPISQPSQVQARDLERIYSNQLKALKKPDSHEEANKSLTDVVKSSMSALGSALQNNNKSLSGVRFTPEGKIESSEGSAKNKTSENINKLFEFSKYVRELSQKSHLSQDEAAKLSDSISVVTSQMDSLDDDIFNPITRYTCNRIRSNLFDAKENLLLNSALDESPLPVDQENARAVNLVNTADQQLMQKIKEKKEEGLGILKKINRTTFAMISGGVLAGAGGLLSVTAIPLHVVTLGASLGVGLLIAGVGMASTITGMYFRDRYEKSLDKNKELLKNYENLRKLIRDPNFIEYLSKNPTINLIDLESISDYNFYKKLLTSYLADKKRNAIPAADQ